MHHQITNCLRDRLLDPLDVGGDVAHERPGGLRGEEIHRLAEHVPVKTISEIHHRALADVAHEVCGEVREQPLRHVEHDDRQGHPFEVDLLDQHVVEDGLDEIGQAGGGNGEPDHRRAGEEEPAPIGSCLREQTT